MKIITKGIFLSLLLCSFSFALKAGNNFNMDDLYKGIEFDMPKVIEPTFQDNTVSITDFGAVGDGLTLNSQAFSDAIEAVSMKGGGRVLIPRGVWLTGPITLKSNINIHTENGALVMFSTNKDLYPLVETVYAGLNTVRCQSPISGKDLENVAFTGDGVFDGSGDVWRGVKRFKMTDAQWKKLITSGGVTNDKGDRWFPSESYKKGDEINKLGVPVGITTMEDFEEMKDYLRPVFVSLINCNKVLLDGPTFQNSPAWNLHMLMCENLTVRNVFVRNPWYSQNGDGLDIESCKNSVVYNCTFDVGDDAICVKSGKNEDGRKRGIPTENLIVKNCIVYHAHGGFVVGSEMSGGVKNMHVSACTFIGTDIGLRFKSTRGRGGIVEDIYISDISMINIPTQAISFNLFYGGSAPKADPGDNSTDENRKARIPAVDETTPSFRDIHMKNIICNGAEKAILIEGLPEMMVKNVSIEDVKMKTNKGIELINAENISFKNVIIETSHRDALLQSNVKGVKFKSTVINGKKIK